MKQKAGTSMNPRFVNKLEAWIISILAEEKIPMDKNRSQHDIPLVFVNGTEVTVSIPTRYSSGMRRKFCTFVVKDGIEIVMHAITDREELTYQSIRNAVQYFTPVIRDFVISN